MDKLPAEILHKIFIQLELNQRTQCLLVCRSWWSVVSGYSLYYDLFLKERHDPPFNRMMNMFERSPVMAAQVEELHIKFQDDTYSYSRRLLNIFPNARVMRLSQFPKWSDPETHYNTKHIDNTDLKARIEYLSDIAPFNVISQLLYSNLGARLRELYLELVHVPDSPTIISRLKDMPVLKTLSLDSPVISIDNLEKIHNNIPSIQNFYLEYMTVERGNMPIEVVPATDIKKIKFYLDNVEHLLDHTQIYQYTIHKYTNITDIEYEDLALNEDYPNDIKELYLNGLLDFYRLIGPCKSDFKIQCLPNGVNVFEVLDAVGAQVKKLQLFYCADRTIFQHLFRSDQYNYVEELNIWGTSLDSIHLIKNMTNLTTLFIRPNENDYAPVHLADCSDACPPSLKSLTIHYDDLIIEPLNNTMNTIETLEINCCRPPSTVGDVISSCFPNIVELHLRFDIAENVNITLNHPHFRKATLYINVDYDLGDFGFSLESPYYTERQYYFSHEGKKTRVLYQDIQDLSILSVVSLIETRMEISGFHINLIRC